MSRPAGGDPVRFAVIGLDHRHAYDLVGGLVEAGGTCVGYHDASTDPRVLAGFKERFPALKPVAEAEQLLDDPSVELICSAGVPSERPALAAQALRRGKAVLLDKPSAIDAAGLALLEAAEAETRGLLSICFTERFLVRACEVATKLVADGALGRVIHTVGLGPHRMNAAIRPDWFFDPARSGGILADIASHQIDGFLHYTGSANAEVVAAAVANRGTPEHPAFQDFGEVMLRSDGASGYVRVDWFTADGLPTWGDGRLTILGTEGTLELRKYCDVAGRPGADHLFLVDRHGTRHLDASREPLTFFSRLLADVRDGTATAMPRGHALVVTRLALEAQARAARLGHLAGGEGTA